MTDLQKALDYRNKKKVQDQLDQEVASSNARITSLETTRTNQDNANAAGATTNFAGKVVVAEGIDTLGPVTGTTADFSGAVTAQNEKLATENFVLANSGGGSGAGNVDVTNTYRFSATEGQTVFTFHFIGSSVGVYLGGLKLDTTDYSLTAATYDANDDLVTESYVTLTEATSAGEIFHGVAFGGADVYNKSQTDALLDAKAEGSHIHSSLTPIQIDASTDLNSLTEPSHNGLYTWTNSLPLNAPCDYAFMFSFDDGSQMIQVVHGSGTNETYQRRNNSGTWSAWIKNVNEDDFPIMKETVGYQKLPSGLMIQWGEANTISSSGDIITFPLAFSTAPIVQGTFNGTSEGDVLVTCTDRSTTSFRIMTYDSGVVDTGRNYGWIAIGY